MMMMMIVAQATTASIPSQEGGTPVSFAIVLLLSRLLFQVQVGPRWLASIGPHDKN